MLVLILTGHRVGHSEHAAVVFCGLPSRESDPERAPLLKQNIDAEKHSHLCSMSRACTQAARAKTYRNSVQPSPEDVRCWILFIDTASQLRILFEPLQDWLYCDGVKWYCDNFLTFLERIFAQAL